MTSFTQIDVRSIELDRTKIKTKNFKGATSNALIPTNTHTHTNIGAHYANISTYTWYSYVEALSPIVHLRLLSPEHFGLCISMAVDCISQSQTFHQDNYES